MRLTATQPTSPYVRDQHTSNPDSAAGHSCIHLTKITNAESYRDEVQELKALDRQEFVARMKAGKAAKAKKKSGAT